MDVFKNIYVTTICNIISSNLISMNIGWKTSFWLSASKSDDTSMSLIIKRKQSEVKPRTPVHHKSGKRPTAHAAVV